MNLSKEEIPRIFSGGKILTHIDLENELTSRAR